MDIQSVMYEGRRKLSLPHISMGIASHGSGFCSHETGTRWDRFVYVLEGVGVFEDDRRRLEVRPGDMLLIPAGSEYWSRWYSAVRMGVINVELMDEKSGQMLHFGKNMEILFHDEHGVYSGFLEEIEARQNGGEPYYCLERLGSAAKLVCDIMREQSRSEYASKLRRIYDGVTYLENNLQKNCSIQELSAMCALSEGGFRRLFFECKGMTPVEYRNSLRARRAAELLGSGKYTVAEAARHVGIRDSKYFSRIFKRYIGVLPSQVRLKPTEETEE